MPSNNAALGWDSGLPFLSGSGVESLAFLSKTQNGSFKEESPLF